MTEQQKIQISDNIAGGEYTNLMQVQHTKEEFILMFANVLPPSGKVVGKLISNPGHYKKMVAALTDNLKKYEEKYGVIEESPELNKEIGFKEEK